MRKQYKFSKLKRVDNPYRDRRKKSTELLDLADARAALTEFIKKGAKSLDVVLKKLCG